MRQTVWYMYGTTRHGIHSVTLSKSVILSSLTSLRNSSQRSRRPTVEQCRTKPLTTIALWTCWWIPNSEVQRAKTSTPSASSFASTTPWGCSTDSSARSPTAVKVSTAITETHVEDNQETQARNVERTDCQAAYASAAAHDKAAQARGALESTSMCSRRRAKPLNEEATVATGSVLAAGATS